MTRRKNPNTVLREAKIQQTLEGIESGLYSSARHAEKETGLPHTVLSA